MPENLIEHDREPHTTPSPRNSICIPQRDRLTTNSAEDISHTEAIRGRNRLRTRLEPDRGGKVVVSHAFSEVSMGGKEVAEDLLDALLGLRFFHAHAVDLFDDLAPE